MIYNFFKKNDKEEFLNHHSKNIFDYILIGSGPASYVLYDNLIKKNYKILIIEKGGLKVPSNIYKKETESLISNENYKIKKNSRVSAFGGSGNIWGGVSSYLEKIEMFNRWGKFQNLWPIHHFEIVRNYQKINSKYGFNINFQIKDLKKNNRDNKLFRTRKFFSYLKPFRFNNLNHYSESNILINAKVNYINEINNQTYLELKNNKMKIFANKIILCCGGLESIFLILRSINNNRLKSIKNKSIVGKYFMDHPKFQLGIVNFTKGKELFLDDVSLKKNQKNFFYKGISLSEKIQIKKKLLNSYVRFEKYYFIDLINRIKKQKFNIKNYIFFLKFIFLKIIQKDHLIEKYKITMYNEMIPNINNKVTYKKEKNKEKFIISYKFSKQEFKTIFFLKNILLKKIELKIIENPNILKKNLKNILIDSSHHMGGTVMGNNYKKSVVNKNLKIHGIKNIYICSTSVFPTSGSVNPTMTLCALAVRLANYLNSKS